MKNWIKRFIEDESGAVTVDWVVLTAFVIALAIGVIGIILAAATDPADSLGAYLATVTP